LPADTVEDVLMAMPLRHLGSLMTLDEWVALPEDNAYRYELQEGVLLVSPRAARRHQLAAQRLSQQLDGHLPHLVLVDQLVEGGFLADTSEVLACHCREPVPELARLDAGLPQD
jgi:hypothetical protein